MLQIYTVIFTIDIWYNKGAEFKSCIKIGRIKNI